MIDAAFELLLSGHQQLAVDDIAAAAGVSTASVFRYFDGLADLQRQAVDRFLDRFSPLLVSPDAGHGRRGERLARLVQVLNKHRLGLTDVEPDMLGRAYEYLLRKFAEGEKQWLCGVEKWRRVLN